MTTSEDRERIVEDLVDNRPGYPRHEAESLAAVLTTSQHVVPYCWECHDFHHAHEKHSSPWRGTEWVDQWLHSGK